MGCHSLLQGNLLDPGIEPVSPALAGGSFATEPLSHPRDVYSSHRGPFSYKKMRIGFAWSCIDLTASQDFIRKVVGPASRA